MDQEKTPRLAQGREHVVATVDEIPSGTHKLVPIGRHGVGVYNVNGTFYVSRAAVVHFRKQESGCYVHITSTSGLIGSAAY